MGSCPLSFCSRLCSALVGTFWGGIVILTLIVSKLIEEVKYCYLDCVTGFVTKGYASLSRISRVSEDVIKTAVFVTRLVESGECLFPQYARAWLRTANTPSCSRRPKSSS